MSPNKPLNLTVDRLAAMLAAADDAAGHHILWFDENGDVRLDGPFSSAERGDWIEANRERIAMRAETFVAGNGYCGQKAGRDTEYVRRLFNEFTEAWASWRPHTRNAVMGHP